MTELFQTKKMRFQLSANDKRRKNRRGRAWQGTTLLEIMIALMVLAVVMALAVPRLLPLSRKAELSAAAEETAAFLEIARRWSVRTGRCHRVREAGNGLVIERRNSADCVNLDIADGWTAKMNLRPEARITLDLTGQSLTPTPDVPDDDHRIVFRPSGRLRGNADLDVTDDGARVVVSNTGIPNTRLVQVTPLGRICVIPIASAPGPISGPMVCP